ncbi:MAG: PAS domain S-box protein [Phenylobacterium sp.]|uniref:hybrid sensor histidine kinase/response regulator n=1 Tax=Phenylobacterium sp. TaxID=1871053 RepID=UPI0017F24255|nr:PAS domain-containing sensor histidine kinase [Phenylobacterium sp.]MBA4794603.1 PAS domain S-box protein [Phenylobacterium sp.]
MTVQSSEASDTPPPRAGAGQAAASARSWAPEMEDRYRLLIESITDYAIYMLDVDGVVASWNPGAERFKGYAAAEILGQHFSRFYTPEDRAAGLPERALRTAAQAGRFEAEGWRQRKDGALFWAHVVMDAIYAPDGALLGFAKITRDLSERREAAAALAQSEQQFRLLVQSVTDYAIFMLDPDGRVMSWNPGAERIKGYAPDEIIGEHFSRFYPPEDQTAGVPAAGLAIAAAEGRWEHEGWRIRRDGERFWAHVVIDAVRDEAGELIGFAKVTRDVTERMEAQKALDETREALFQAQKMEALGQLTGGVAHDFNNLLMAVLGSLELVRKRLPYDPGVTPLLENAIHGAERGANLIQRMLAFARRQELKIEAVDLATTAEGMVSFLRRSLGPRVRIDLDLPRGLPLLRTDPNQLEAALLNLCVNARDAMEDGGVITISATEETLAAGRGLAEGRYVRIRVSDTGCGMDEPTLARVLEPFFTTKGVGQGTGLGLPMVHGLANQSGGKLDIVSRPGAGTAVDLWLPAMSREAPADMDRSPAAAPEAKPPVPLTILAVDDDRLVLNNTIALLEDLGHEVLQATSGEAALGLLTDDIDLLVTDQLMPQMTGDELARRARARQPDLPVLLVSGYGELSEEGGPQPPRLAKPFTQAELAEAIAELTGHKRQ